MGTRRIAVLVLVLVLGVPLVVPVSAAAGPPPNDDFDSATEVLPVPFEEIVDTTEATLEAGEPRPSCGFRVGRTVWYRFTGADDFISADTRGSDFDTVLAVWTGPDFASLQQVACNDDAITLGAQVPFYARSGETYYIQVGGFRRAGGELRFRMRTIQAGLIQGTVTQEETGAPLEGICVEALDRDVFSVQTVTTGEDGSYELVVRPGSYLVLFLDLCDPSDDHIPEWFDDVPFSQVGDADPVDVAADAVVVGDAELERGCPRVASAAALDGFNQIVGTAASETLVGTPASDVICGLAGRDTLRGRDGDDMLIGGRGSDRLLGGRGRDTTIGGPGRDTVSGGPGGDFVAGNAGNDRLRGGRENDFLLGGRGRDVCFGGPGVDHARGCEVARGVVDVSSIEIARRHAALVASWTQGVPRHTLLSRLRR